MTQEFVLRAMAKNYAGGHSWDHLDGETCIKAADEIARLREALSLAKSDMMTAVRHVEREIVYVPPSASGELMYGEAK
jgi:hypothetical protein